MELIYIYIIILVIAKIWLHFVVNIKMNKQRVLNSKKCPFCGKEFLFHNNKCNFCNRELSNNQYDIVCMNCYYIGKMKKYSQETEFLITLLLFALLTLPAIIYYFLYRNRTICRNCGRMTRKGDYL